ncbi:hypothetical protein LTR56_016591 [Elasticomyces elasticus]|nr:hypothetical protein LTR56_016591 [Elasticomyces elasticus]KAK3650622.1 hypothetical protein LTR22_012480 [Elasticomyces elasticus]KAK4913955.1 hypothetical protein LTR49_017773 [Elasticomyces elasticus]KAK5753119.1 hypothetical protein LTS12_016798 [Elasticomyces elasticus]
MDQPKKTGAEYKELYKSSHGYDEYASRTPQRKAFTTLADVKFLRFRSMPTTGMLGAGSFKPVKSRLVEAGWEYQLERTDGQLYNGGNWVPQSDLQFRE